MRGIFLVCLDHNFDIVMEDYFNRRITAKKAKELLNLKHTTFYKLLKEYRGEKYKDV